MTKNLLLIAVRVLLKQKTNTIIKIGGLAVGFTCCLLILLYVHFESNYDSFHRNGNNIYRVVQDVSLDGRITEGASTPGPVGPALMNDVSEVVNSVRFTGSSMLMKYGENHYQEDNIYFADPSVFDVFTFPMLKGDPQTALTKPNSIVLTEKASQRYFGNDDPIGKTMIIDNELEFVVTGVIEDLPGNSHLRFDMLLSMTTRGSPEFLSTWAWSTYTYVQIDPTVDLQTLNQKLSQFSLNHKAEMTSGGETSRVLSAQPLKDIHLYSRRLGEPGTPGNPTNLMLFAIVAVLVLVIACVNFINLTTAQAANRAREVGIRKVIGGTRLQLVNQFLAESILLSISASVIAFGAADVLLPLFTQLTGTPISFDLFYTLPAITCYATISLLIGCLAGWYPALVLSGFAPASVLKGVLKMSSKSFLREGLIVFQFAVSIALVVGTIVVYTQLHFMQTRELGYDREQVLVVYFGDDDSIQAKTETLKQELLRNPLLTDATASSHVPGKNVAMTKMETTSLNGEQRALDVALVAVDFDFNDFYKIPVVAGRTFSERITTDAMGFVVNESTVRQLGFATPEEVLDREITVRGQTGKVIGVVKDFHYASLHKSIEPLVMRMRSKSLSYISLKIQAGSSGTIVAALESEWKQLAPTRPFDYFFLDAQFDQQYRADRQFGQLFAWSAGISIVLACLGLFGLVSFIVEQRTKEIGIRKVLGASVTGVVALLSMNFVKLILAAIVIASGVSWYTMDKWLQEFPYRVDMQWWMFAMAGAAGLFVALFTIGFKSVKAAMANPVSSLRSE
ncbi:MAG TPA: ABC transporter permease [Cyclobacteriaceae bacterium]|nr:ABC transporter permease [Cyclobacteriaceae bacterium]